MMDGTYVRDEGGTLFFAPAPPLTDDDVHTIVETTAQRVVRGRLPTDGCASSMSRHLCSP